MILTAQGCAALSRFSPGLVPNGRLIGLTSTDILPLKDTRPVTEARSSMGSSMLPITLPGLVQTASVARHEPAMMLIGVVVRIRTRLA